MKEAAGADVDFGDSAVGTRGFVEGPEERVALPGGGEALRNSRETLCHAEGEAEVDGHRVSRPRTEEGASDWVQDCGVDEAFARSEIVVCGGEIALERGFCQGADGFGVERLGFSAEQDAGGGVIFLGEFIGVEKVGGSERPGGGRDRCEGIRDEAEGTPRGRLWGGVGCGDEDGFAGEGEGEVAECGVEGLLLQRGEADEEAAGVRCGGG